MVAPGLPPLHVAKEMSDLNRLTCSLRETQYTTPWPIESTLSISSLVLTVALTRLSFYRGFFPQQCSKEVKLLSMNFSLDRVHCR